ncbi:DNA-binding response regulator [Sphingomonas sp. DBB INV C78]|uniref:response regulator n=1 Tax=Sphingomonas sp. DBB INV C78 TaxID=3349434 RepID=UPI0036D22A50
MNRKLLKILIADDHGAMRRGLSDLLVDNPHGRVVAEAADGREALELARAKRPDIAIVDYSLSLLNGLDLTRALIREIAGIQILIYTMHDREEILADLLRAGARGYVLKSDPETHLKAAIAALAEGLPYFSGKGSEALLKHYLNGKTSPTGLKVLTSREREIVQLIAEGQINKQIARKLDISTKTVETHRAAAMHKLHLRTTAELVRYALRNNIVEA